LLSLSQLNKFCDLVKAEDIQLVMSILKDKLQDGLIGKAHVAIELSQKDKLFRIEETAE
jgi:hypothetical protein